MGNRSIAVVTAPLLALFAACSHARSAPVPVAEIVSEEVNRRADVFIASPPLMGAR